MSRELSYKTHILIGVRPQGVMTVIADWPHVPKQADVERETATWASRCVRRRRSCRREATETPPPSDWGFCGECSVGISFHPSFFHRTRTGLTISER